MFDPEYQNIECLKCTYRRIYCDRRIGFYCIYCGYRLNHREVLMLIEKTIGASRARQGLDEDTQQRIGELKDLPSKAGTTGHVPLRP